MIGPALKNGLTVMSSNSQPPIPIGNQTAQTQIGGTGTAYPATAIPVIDPGEPFADMAWQITGSKQSTNPYVTWPPSSTENLMQGFTADYASQGGVCVTPGELPRRDELLHAGASARDGLAGEQVRRLRPVVRIRAYAHLHESRVRALRRGWALLFFIRPAHLRL